MVNGISNHYATVVSLLAIEHPSEQQLVQAAAVIPLIIDLTLRAKAFFALGLVYAKFGQFAPAMDYLVSAQNLLPSIEDEQDRQAILSRIQAAMERILV